MRLTLINKDQLPMARNTTKRAKGANELEPVVGLVDLEPGDSLLLCTDGLTKHVAEERIEAVLAGPDPADTSCRTLVNDALAGGGTDNVTVIVVKTR